ncbi:uncharacterized protein LOC143453253 isoform X3 [Clavelina lepadiformis]|uniref:uncharacterized protein LOC143453253 isoform X3 n=1 Tax=Clavelina lepadiformis TaxID=159417 RepID=UPI004041CE2C
MKCSRVFKLVLLFTAAVMRADPHLRTLDNVPYSYSGLGEYTLLQADNGSSINVQARMVRNVDVDGNPVNASVTSSVVIVNAGDDVPTRFQFDVANSTSEDFENSSIAIYVNGSRLKGDQRANLDSSLPLSFSSAFLTRDLSGNVLVNINESPQRQALFAISSNGRVISISVALTTASYEGKVDGLYGLMDGDSTNDFRLRNGTTLDFDTLTFTPITSPNNSAEERWNLYIPDGAVLTSRITEFAESWRTTAEESLFAYEGGQSWSTFNDLSFVGENLQVLLDEASDESLAQAAAACGEVDDAIGKSQCLHDVLVNKDPSRNSGGLGPGPTFTGLFTWKPLSTDVRSITIYATDSTNLTSSVGVTIRLCACANNGTCSFANFAVADNSNRFYVGSCMCPDAYDGLYCDEDFNPCLSEPPCYDGVECTDVPAPGSGYECGACPSGSTGDGVFCSVDACLSKPCEQLCQSIFERFACSCEDGYVINASNNTLCDDVNECDVGTAICDLTTTTCNNTEGSYVCECESGFIPGPSSNTSCVDRNECDLGVDSCSLPGQVCNNTFGGFRCDCAGGYEPSATSDSCQDVNECLNDPCPAGPIGSCNNTDGTYSCNCVGGFIYNQATNTCDDVNECLANGGKGNCSDECRNTNAESTTTTALAPISAGTATTTTTPAPISAESTTKTTTLAPTSAESTTTTTTLAPTSAESTTTTTHAPTSAESTTTTTSPASTSAESTTTTTTLAPTSAESTTTTTSPASTSAEKTTTTTTLAPTSAESTTTTTASAPTSAGTTTTTTAPAPTSAESTTTTTTHAPSSGESTTATTPASTSAESTTTTTASEPTSAESTTTTTASEPTSAGTTTTTTTPEPTSAESTTTTTASAPTSAGTTTSTTLAPTSAESTTTATSHASTSAESTTTTTTLAPTSAESTTTTTSHAPSSGESTTATTPEPTSAESTTTTTTPSPTSPESMTTTSSPGCPPLQTFYAGQCVAFQRYVITLVYNITFDPRLNDPTSEEAKAFIRRFKNGLDIIFAPSIEVSYEVSAGFVFTEGSTIVSSPVGLANVTSETDVGSLIRAGIANNATGDPALTSASASNFNECSDDETNDCGTDASCGDITEYPGYVCTCDPGFRDKNTTYTGRECEEQCVLDGESYCLNGGSCNAILHVGDPLCTCTQWYIGTRCENLNSSVVAALAVGLAAVVLAVVTLVLIACIKCRKKSPRRLNLRSSKRSRGSLGKYSSTNFNESWMPGTFTKVDGFNR